jgi:hypothetical protein
VADLELARILVERSVQLDESYQQAAGHTFLGYDDSILSPALGGNPDGGRQHFERALTLTERKALLVQVNYARSYAAQTQSRDLFVSLLNEVVSAPDDEEARRERTRSEPVVLRTRETTRTRRS